jgi:DNA-binding beta-propeller fold protein YncE
MRNRKALPAMLPLAAYTRLKGAYRNIPIVSVRWRTIQCALARPAMTCCVFPRRGHHPSMKPVVINCRTMLKPLSLFLLLSVIYLMTFPSHSRAQARSRAKTGSVLLVANQGDRTLSIINPATVKQIAAVPEGGITGHEVAASPDGRTAYVPIYGDSGVGKPGSDGRNMVVIDIATRKVIGNVDFGHGVRPHCVIYDPNSDLLYVTTELDQTVTAVDPHSLKVVGTIPTTQAESHMLAISHDGRRGYTANVGPGTVSMLDMTARKTITVIPVSPTIQRISISNDDSMVFTADQTKPQLAVIDTSAIKLKTWVPLPAIGYGTASTKDGRWLLVAMPSINKVAAIDLGAKDVGTLKVVRTIDVPHGPAEILMRPDGKVAYVSCPGSNQVAAIDLEQWKVEALIDAGEYADGLAWAGKPPAQSSKH